MQKLKSQVHYTMSPKRRHKAHTMNNNIGCNMKRGNKEHIILLRLDSSIEPLL